MAATDDPSGRNLLSTPPDAGVSATVTCEMPGDKAMSFGIESGRPCLHRGSGTNKAIALDLCMGKARGGGLALRADGGGRKG